MKKVEAVVRTSRLDDVVNRLCLIGITGLTVAEVTRPDGGFTVAGGATVQVLVPSASLPDVLTALSADGTVDVVPVPGSGS